MAPPRSGGDRRGGRGTAARPVARWLWWTVLVAVVLITAGTAVRLFSSARAEVPRGIPSALVLEANGESQQSETSAPPAEDNDLSVTLSTDKPPTGSGVYVSVVGRRAPAGQYEAKVRLAPGGPVSVTLVRRTAAGVETELGAGRDLTGVSLSDGQPLRVRLRVNGTGETHLALKAWAATGKEPDAWTVSATDTFDDLQEPGRAGVRGYLSRAATNAPVAVTIKDVVLAPAGESPAPGPARIGRASTSAGAAAPGTTQYPFPDAALFVAQDGDDAAPGTQEQPLRTVALAVAKAVSPSTVVLRGGNYHESVTLPAGKTVTLQAYPGEEVWFDGSTPVTSWVSDSGAWRADGWDARFDDSPTYTPGAPDGTEPGRSFVSPAFPMAAHPDMLFIDGVAQRQVGSREEVTGGTFFADYGRARLYVGSDPAGREVRASELSTALTVRGEGSVVRGVGVRRYATSVPQLGAVLVLARKVVVEDVTVADNATEGVFVGARQLGTEVTLRRVTAERNGLLGIASSYADGLRLEGVRAVSNNVEHFNTAPVSGGAKITRARGVAVVSSVFSDNEGPGLWLDESVYDAVVTGNDLLGNTRHGLSFELSAKGRFVDNLVARNLGTGMKLNNSSDVQVWNNTFVDNGDKPLSLVQDSRTAQDLSTPGHDPRQGLPDPTVTWVLGPATVRNNVFSKTSGACFVCVEDPALSRSAATIGVSMDGDVFYRASPDDPSRLVLWANGKTKPSEYPDLATFRSYTGQEPHGRELVGAPVVDAAAGLTDELRELQDGTAQPLDPAVATLSGRSPGETHLGVWFD